MTPHRGLWQSGSPLLAALAELFAVGPGEPVALGHQCVLIEVPGGAVLVPVAEASWRLH